jgi:DNA-binding FadR family transcriptional regulator
MSIINTLGKVSRERTGASRAVREHALRDHRRIVEALRANDPEAAATAMGEHLDHVEQALKSPAGTGGPSNAAANPGPEAGR